MFHLMILLALMADGPKLTDDIEIVDEVDIIVMNHMFSDAGAITFDQYIFYGMYFEAEYYGSHVVDWIMSPKEDRRPYTEEEHRAWLDEMYVRHGIKAGDDDLWNRTFDGFTPPNNGRWTGASMAPRYDKTIKKWVMRFEDKRYGSKHVFRTIIADSFYETFTQYDPEQLDGKIMPQDQRRKLTPLRPKKGDQGRRANPQGGDVSCNLTSNRFDSDFCFLYNSMAEVQGRRYR